MSLDLDDYKFPATFESESNIVIHTWRRANWAQGRHMEEVQERWEPQQTIGSGSFGTVRLEKRIGGENMAYTHRAVKQLQKGDMAKAKFDYRKELATLIKFSRSKVRSPYASKKKHS